MGLSANLATDDVSKIVAALCSGLFLPFLVKIQGAGCHLSSPSWLGTQLSERPSLTGRQGILQVPYPRAGVPNLFCTQYF